MIDEIWQWWSAKGWYQAWWAVYGIVMLVTVRLLWIEPVLRGLRKLRHSLDAFTQTYRDR